MFLDYAPFLGLKKDYILTLGLRNEVGVPFPLNMALLRHMLKSLDAKKVKYEIW